MAQHPLDRARAVADAIRSALPEQAAAIDRAVAEAEAQKRDAIEMTLGIRFKLEKFDAAAPAGTPPYETIEGEG